MSEKSENHTEKFKKSVVKLAVESDQPVAETARDLGVNVNALPGWINKHNSLFSIFSQV